MKSYVQPPVDRSGGIIKIILLNLLLLISLCANAGGNIFAADKKITGKVLDSKAPLHCPA